MRTFGFPEFLFILDAARWTLALSAIAFIGGAILGLIIALMRTCDSVAARRSSAVFIQIFQGTPLLLQLFLIFFGAPVMLPPGKQARNAPAWSMWAWSRPVTVETR